MSWADVFLAVIALATLTMAAIQVGVIVAALRVARQAQETLATVRQDVAPLVSRVTAVAEEASKTAALATAQAQKVDRLVTDLSQRVEYTAAVVQEAVVTPARQGMAIVAAAKAVLGVFGQARDLRPRHRRPAEEEDPLFIG